MDGNSKSPGRPERREYHQIRGIFLQACELLAPIVAGNDPVKTVSTFAMTHMMQDRFPELLTEEIHMVIMTVEQMHKEQRLHAKLNKKS